jgi:hypothetical protein
MDCAQRGQSHFVTQQQENIEYHNNLTLADVRDNEYVA